MSASEARSTQHTSRNGLLRMAVLGVVALLTLGLGVNPAAAESKAPAEAPTSSVQPASQQTAPAAGVGIQAQFVHNTSLYYWGAYANVGVSSGEVSLGVFCTGWGWYQTGWMGVAPDGSPGIWTAWVDCGRFIPATQYRYQTRG